jgi:hypothetical protein
LIHDSRVRRILDRAGYRSVAFASGYHATEIESADVYLEPSWTLSEFQDALMAMTPIPTLLEALVGRSQLDWHRDRIENALGRLASLPGRYPEPMFVFAHIFSPHPPFVFAADGSPRNSGKPFSTNDGTHFMRRGSPEEYIDGYGQQAQFIGRRILQAVEEILERSERPPVIIIQSDHGPGLMMNHDSLQETNLHERFSILNAIYLPDMDWGEGSPGSPVNTFRLIFNHLFATELELLEDRSFYASWVRPYQLLAIQIPEGGQQQAPLSGPDQAP